MVKGTVKFFSPKKGFGFITAEDGNDVFVHFSAITGPDDQYKTLYGEDEVEFEVVEGEKGPQASNVVVTKKAPRKPKQFNKGGRKNNFR